MHTIPHITGPAVDALAQRNSRLLGNGHKSVTHPDRVRERSAYAAGQHDRKFDDWLPATAGPNRLAERSLPLAKRRIRDLVRSNPLIGGVETILRNNVVGGRGILAIPATQWPEFNKAATDFVLDRIEYVDVDREASLADSQATFLSELFAAGDCLTRYAFTDKHGGLPAGPAIELIESDRVDFGYSAGPATAAGGANRVRQGVEFDGLGRRVAYHVLKGDPHDAGGFALPSMPDDRERIAATDATLGFVRREIKQIRGVPWPIKAAVSTKMEDAVWEATILLQRAAASVGLFISGADVDRAASTDDLMPAVVDASGDIVQYLRAGMIGFLPHGATPHLMAPDIDAPGFAEIEMILHRRMAAGLGLSYSAVSRDFARANFSSNRAEQLEDRRAYRPLQALIYRSHTCPFYRRLIDWGVVSGELKLKERGIRKAWLENRRLVYQCKMIAPGWEWVDPQKDAGADKIALDTGIKSPQEIISARGRRWQDVVDERVEYEKYVREAREAAGLPEPVAADGDDERRPGEGDEDNERDQDEPREGER